LIVVGFFAAHFSATFEGLRDDNYKDLPGLIDAVIADRKSLLFSDSIRSVIFMLISATLLWFVLQNKLKQVLVFVGLGLLILVDQISVNRRYLNADDFVSASKVEKPFTASEADKLILEDKTHFRVANFSTNLMEDGATSYFHQSIGGYHAAKMRRYQELFEYQIAKQNMQVLNMLNTKYFIIPDNSGVLQVQQNQAINGNVWFVDSLDKVQNATEEMNALDSLDSKTTAVVDFSKFSELKNFTIKRDPTATISLKKYAVTNLTYQSTSQKEQLAVFSEIYYDKGWNAYIDGELVPHFRVNYVLRGLKVPAGNHTIIFKFEPTVIQQGSFISLSSYGLLLLISLGWFFYEKKKGVKN
jgi:uncharacterized membrane protein YfhO